MADIFGIMKEQDVDSMSFKEICKYLGLKPLSRTAIKPEFRGKPVSEVMRILRSRYQ